MNNTPYQIALVGMSGKGKTMSFRNMDPDTTGFINLEGKPLPFINKFKHYAIPNSWQECYQTLIEFAKNSDIKVVVLDSFSAYVDSLLKTARDTKKMFEIWNLYNSEIGKLLFLIKKYTKHIIVTAHYAWIESEEGAIEKRISVKGKEWNKAGIEKEFTIVNYTDMIIKDGKRQYLIYFNSDGKSSAKTPPIFLTEGQETMENDYAKFIEQMNKVLKQG